MRYTMPIELLPTPSSQGIKHCAIYLHVIGPTHSLSSVCLLNSFMEAKADCETALSLDPKYVKAFSRLGAIQFFLKVQLTYDLLGAATRLYTLATDVSYCAIGIPSCGGDLSEGSGD